MSRPLSHAEVLALAARLPHDRPYTAAEATSRGVDHHRRRRLVGAGLVISPCHGVYWPAGLADTLELRVATLRLVVPDDCVVTDRTAAWLWGAVMVLAPGDHERVPTVSVFAPPGRRLRNGLTASGERMLSADDVVALDGLRVTTPLRTACDLLRLLHRDQAIGCADALAALGCFTVDDLVGELVRFRGYRGVVQARVLAPLVDPRSGSPMEGIGRLRWHDAGLPWPRCQVEVPAPAGHFAIDVGSPEHEFGLEYFGDEFHGSAHRAHDEARLAWLRDVLGWTIVVARRVDVMGPHQSLEETLRREWKAHQARRRR